MRGLLLSLEEAFFYFQYFCEHNTMLYSCAFLLLVLMVILGALIALSDLRWLDVSKRYWMKCNTSARSPYFMSTAKEFYYISFSSLEISQCTHKIQLNKQKFKVYLHKLAWCCVVYNKDNQNKLNSCKYWISMKNKNIYISTLFTNVNSPKITMRNQVD